MILLLNFLLFPFIYGKIKICNINELCDKDNDFKIQKPFCGSDGRSYKSICQLKISICKGRNVIKLFDGHCFSKSTCIEEREKRKEYNKNLEFFHHESAPYIPRCHNDTGAYSEVQCQYNNQYCWCVKKNGLIIPDTATRNDKPFCKKRKVIHISRHSKQNKDNMININNCSAYFTKDDDSLQNFPHMNTDDMLKNKNVVIRLQNPSSIVKVGIQTNDEPTNCKFQRKIVLDRTPLTKLSSTYIPICQKIDEDLYEEIQCHPITKVCWCVDTVNGYPLHGTSVKDRLPSCSKRTSTIKVRDVISRFEIKKCPPKKRIRFYRLFFIKIVNNMKAKHNSTLDIREIEKNFDKDTKINMVLWEFEELDKDKNGDLDEKELIALKKNFKKNRNVRSCVKNFNEFCDSDNDKVISKKEWTYCTVEASLSSSLLSIGEKPHANPFLHILKPE
uniref:Thyroglobulin type-1 domain-containing protein n=1 Tax=Strongyloides venezuelensis TaxID=75913 RepID=A0A0K0FVL1_STRVS